MLWACIALPQLALDCVLRRHAQAAEPLVLVGGPAQRRVLLAANAQAQQRGLRAGQRLTQAQAIASGFIAVPHSPAESRHWQALLAGWACRYSAQVFADWPQALVLEVGSSLRLMGGWEALQAHWRSELELLQFQHRIALAPTPHAAHVLAWLRDGLQLHEPAALQATLDAVPVRRAALPGDAGERLHRLGIRRLQQLFALPRASLQRRFGAALLEYVDQLRGLAPPQLPLFQPPERFDLRIELAFHVESHMPLLFPLRRLVADLAVFLSARDRGVQRFVLLLEHEAQPPTRVVLGLLAPERDAGRLLDLIRSRLEHTRLPAPVQALRLQARQLPRFQPAGRDLFDERPAGALPWEQLRERLRARLGSNALYQIEPQADPRPERAWRRCVTATATAAGADGPLRPGWLLPTPQPPQGGALRILAGPERLESGWWDGDDARRDYYLVQTPQGLRAWAFTPAGQRGPWMLHGWFA